MFPAPKPGEHNIKDWYGKIRNICKMWCVDNEHDRKLGGVGRVVEIDESLFFRGKYGYGHFERPQVTLLFYALCANLETILCSNGHLG